MAGAGELFLLGFSLLPSFLLYCSDGIGSPVWLSALPLQGAHHNVLPGLVGLVVVVPTTLSNPLSHLSWQRSPLYPRAVVAGGAMAFGVIGIFLGPTCWRSATRWSRTGRWAAPVLQPCQASSRGNHARRSEYTPRQGDQVLSACGTHTATAATQPCSTRSAHTHVRAAAQALGFLTRSPRAVPCHQPARGGSDQGVQEDTAAYTAWRSTSVRHHQGVHHRSEQTSTRHSRSKTDDGTRLYDAVGMVINQQLSRVQGRKAIVLSFTDGVDTTSRRASYDSNVMDAQELDALIYPVQYDTSSDMNVIVNQPMPQIGGCLRIDSRRDIRRWAPAK